MEEIVAEAVEGRVYKGYPDYEYREFRSAVSSFYGLDEKLVVPLGGAAELLPLALSTLRPGAILSVEPTFGDHFVHASALGVNLFTVPYLEYKGDIALDPGLVCDVARRLEGGLLVVVSNPNNPTGHLTPSSVLEELALCIEGRGHLVVDEAFMEFTGSQGLLPEPPPGAIVVRSLTKIFASPGLRAGFAYTLDQRLASKLDSARQAWNIGSIASYVYTRLLSDLGGAARRHIAATQAAVREALENAVEALLRAGVKVYRGSGVPYVLVRHSSRHPRLQEELVARGFYVRDASSFHYLTPHHSRISIKRGVGRLARALAEADRAAQGV